MESLVPLKPSRFNVFHHQQGAWYCFNSLSSALFAVGEPAYRLIEQCLQEFAQGRTCSSPALGELLVQNGFLVPAQVDELEREHQRYEQTKRNSDWAFLTLVPTLGCNLKCSYCFQKDLPPAKAMDLTTARRVVALFDQLADRVQGMAVVWFGGEPLLAPLTLDYLTREFKKICTARSLPYVAEMITNGTLLRQENLAWLGQLGLQKMEISLDGLPETHQRRKGGTLDAASQFYDFLFHQSDALLAVVQRLILRINVDRDNCDEAKIIVRQMKETCRAIERVDFRLQVLAAGKGLVECIPHNCYSQSDVSGVEAEFKHFLAREGLPVRGFPKPIDHPCMAVRKWAFTIDPEGHLGRCVPAVGQLGEAFYRLPEVGSLDMVSQLASCQQPYVTFDPFTIKLCQACAFLPLCLGQCPREHELTPFYCRRKARFEAELPLFEGLDRGLATV